MVDHRPVFVRDGDQKRAEGVAKCRCVIYTPAMSNEAPISSSALPDVRAKKGRIVGVLVGIAVLLAGGVGGFVWYQNKAAADREAQAHGAIVQCLFGDEALNPGERPSARFRRIQLTALSTDPVKSTEPVWPASCAAEAHALNEALTQAGHASKDKKDVAYWAEHLGKVLKDPNPQEDAAEIVEHLWQALGQEKLAKLPAPGVKPPPKAANTMSVDTLKGVLPLTPEPIKLDLIKTERVTHSESLRFYVDRKAHLNTPLLCRLEDELVCRPVDAKIADRELMLFGSADPGTTPLLFAPPIGEGGIFVPEDATEVAALPSYGAWTTKGARHVVGYDKAKQKFRLLHFAGTSKSEELFSIKGVTDDTQVSMLFDTIVYGADGSLWSQRVGASGPPGAAVNLGPAADIALGAGAIRGCRSADALVVSARTVDGEMLTMDTGDRWWPLRRLWGIGGVLSCRGREATVTRRSIAYQGSSMIGEVSQEHCTVDACSMQAVDLRAFFRDVREMVPHNSGLFQTGELDGKLLVVWKAGKKGGVRMRLAPPDQIAKVDDAIFFDDLVHDGEIDKATSTLLDLRLFSRSSVAVLLMQTTLGVHAMKIEPSGKITPLPVRLER
jgi:hypothetical protein